MARFATHRVAGLVAAVLLSAAPPAAAGARSPAPRLPADGLAVERELAAGEHHAWAVELAAGGFLRAVADQQGIDVVLRLLPAAGGEPLVEADSPNGAHGPERLSFVAETAGVYLFEVRSNYADRPDGRYALTVAPPRPASEDDRRLAAAEAAELRGIVDDLVVRTAESRRRAVESYRRALGLWRELGDERREAETLNHLGFVYSRLGEVDLEAEAFARHLEIVRRLGDEEETARSLLNVAAAYAKQGRLDAAEPLYRQALATFQRLGNRFFEASVLSSLGSLHSARGELEAAVDAFERSLDAHREVGNARGQSLALINLGRMHNRLGHTAAAVERAQEALALARATDDERSVAAALNNLGVVYEFQGRLQEALSAHHEVLELHRRLGNRRGEAVTLGNLGSVHNRIGRHQEALELFARALDIQRQVGDRLGEAKALSNLGYAHEDLDELDAATPYLEQALDLARRHGDRALEVAMLLHLGRAHGRQGREAEALARLEPGLALAREIGLRFTEANLLLEIGRTIAARDPDAALRRLEESMAILAAIGDPLGQAAAHFEIARVERRRGRLETARDGLESALALLEEVRTTVDVLELRSSLMADRGDYHEAYVDVLMALHDAEPAAGWDRRAFAAAEAARARSFLDLLRESEIAVRKDADPELLARERDLHRRLNSLERYRRELSADREANRERLAAVERELAEARQEGRRLEAGIRASSPRYADLTSPEPLTVEAVRERLLDADTALLTFSLGARESYLWVVTSATLASFRLPPRGELEAAARDLHERLSRPGGGSAEAARRLGELLLAPAAPAIAGKRLVVVADGALHYLPFAVLGDPASTEGAPLVAAHEVVQLPSASALDLLRRDAAGRAPPERLLAVFADPVFDGGDSRFAARRQRLAESGEAPRGDAAGLGFRRLRFSASEAERIAALVPADQRLERIGFAATREAATSPALADYRYIHFATHGVLDARYPQLSGLVLSLVDESGAPAEGFLRLHDLYNLEWNADLVTLSACRTALGQEIRGEGLVGLTRGFMYAGAARVVASLWDVQDRATTEIMARFYRAMIEDGLAPAAALRRAQLSMRGETRWSDPYYWSPFVLQGEWR